MHICNFCSYTYTGIPWVWFYDISSIKNSKYPLITYPPKLKEQIKLIKVVFYVL